MLINWQNTTANKITKSANFVNGTKYLCKVKALSVWGNSEKNSNSVLYFITTGLFDITKFSPATNQTYGRIASGEATYTNTTITDLNIEIYYKNSKGQYLDVNGKWTTTTTIHVPVMTELGDNRLKFQYILNETDTGFSGSAQIVYTLIHTPTGIKLNTQSVSVAIK